MAFENRLCRRELHVAGRKLNCGWRFLREGRTHSRKDTFSLSLRFRDLKAFEMLNDLLMLTKFNRNAESERASGAFRRGRAAWMRMR